MNGAELIARGGLVAPGSPSPLLVLAVLVGGFWVTVGAIFFAIWFARYRTARRRAIEARHAEEEREHVAYLQDLKTGEQSSPSLRLPPELSESAKLLRGEHRFEG
ncbi:hypothetical protein [Actinophytocola sp.]|uniref:hypothetical protein n=1 Tax=Actinophytocola sp. TaxID=1872138 RepID=UPI002D7EA83D|nr:hypothetical protein [Actinophytocola sp.]HET9144128.1 hypothetical protein [Actinophytocola sp.]